MGQAGSTSQRSRGPRHVFYGRWLVGVSLFTLTAVITPIFQGLGITIAALVRTVPAAYLFALLYGTGLGARVPLLTAIRGDYFGRKNFGTILGFSQIPMNILTMGAPLGAGYAFDLSGTYTVPFLGLATMNFVAAAAILMTRKPDLAAARRQRAIAGAI